MRIALLVEYLGGRGGSEEYLRAVALGLRTRGHQVSCWYVHTGDLKGASWQAFIRDIPSDQLAAAPADWERWLDARTAADEPDLVFVHNVAIGPALVLKLRRRACVVRFVHDFRPVCLRTSRVLPISRHSCDRALGAGCLLHACSIGPSRQPGLPISWNSLRERLQERDACARMDRLLVASRFMQRVLLHNGFPEERIGVVPMFAPLAASPPAPTPPPADRLLFVGQIQRHKGLQVLLRALSLARPSITLDVAGDGPWRRRCEEIARRLRLAHRVSFHGWVTREALPRFLEGAGVVVIPSLWNEPFGLVGLEAMSYGRAVIAFDVGGVRDWLEPDVSGLLVPPNDTRRLVQAIDGLCGAPERIARMGLAGRQRALERFTFEGHLDALVGEMASAMTRDHGPPCPA